MTLALAVVTVACTGGTETGNPSFAVTMAVDAHSSEPARVAVRVTQGGATIDEAWLVLGDLRFVPCEGTATPVVLPGLGVADHANPGPTLQSFELMDTPLCTMDVPFVPATDAPTGAPANIVGRSILLAGSTTDGTRFEIAAAPSAQVLTPASTATSFSVPEATAALFLGFDVAAWTAGIDFGSLTPATDGTLVIDETNNTDALAIFEANVSAGVTLYLDEGGNGAADPGDPVLATVP